MANIAQSIKKTYSWVFAPYVRMAHHTDFDIPSKERLFPWRRLLDYELIYIDRGKGTLFFDGGNTPVRQGGLYLIQPGLRHKASFFGGRHLYIHFDLFYNTCRGKSFIKPWGHETITDEETGWLQPALDDTFGFRLPVESPEKDAGTIRPLMEECLALFKDNPSGWDLKIQGRLISLLEPFLMTAPASGVDQPHGAGLDERLDRVERYIRANLHVPVTLKDLARLGSLSPFYLCRLFKKRFGTGPVQFHHRLRMEEAARRLRETGKPVKEVARELGIENPYIFSRAMKNHHGVSPRTLRAINTA